MPATIISPSGKILRHVATHRTTVKSDGSIKVIKIKASQATRLAENEEYLKNKNVKAFLDTIAKSEGGDYQAKFGFGWAPGWKRGEWTFTDDSTHPGAGYGGSTTASGRYQITIVTWNVECVAAMGLSDFTPHTQDLIAVEILRSVHAIDPLVNGDINDVIPKAARRWESLPLGPGMANRPLNGGPSGQPYMPYDEVLTTYGSFGGTTK
jgi:muramidase (phage lysozyme)